MANFGTEYLESDTQVVPNSNRRERVGPGGVRLGAEVACTVTTAERQGVVVWDWPRFQALIVIALFFLTPAEASGGAIAMGGSDLFFFGPTHFSNNFAVVEGGAVVVLADSFLLFFAPTVFKSNSARDGGALHGFLCNVGVLDGAVWRNNQARGAGGGVRMVSSEMSLLGESELTSNAAGSDGGAMQLVSVEFLLLEDVRFASNSAGASGGAMSMMSVGAAPNLAEGNERVGPASVDNCRFESNQAQDLGGAVHTMGGYANFFDSDFFNNTAGK